MNQTTTVVLICIEGAGLAITIGFAIAGFVAYRKAKKRADEVIKRGKPYMKEFKKFLRNISALEES